LPLSIASEEGEQTIAREEVVKYLLSSRGKIAQCDSVVKANNRLQQILTRNPEAVQQSDLVYKIAVVVTALDGFSFHLCATVR
jgi:hypothetical protein